MGACASRAAISDSDGAPPGARGPVPWSCLSSGYAYPTPIPPGGVKWGLKFEREGRHAQVSRGRVSNTSGTAVSWRTVSCARWRCRLCATVSYVRLSAVHRLMQFSLSSMREIPGGSAVTYAQCIGLPW